MGTFYSNNDYRNYLVHHGVKGMKWGVRRYQNADGSLTSAGKARAKRDGTGLLARTKIRAQGHFGQYAEYARGIKNAKGIRRKLSAAVGHGQTAALQRNARFRFRGRNSSRNACDRTRRPPAADCSDRTGPYQACKAPHGP